MSSSIGLDFQRQALANSSSNYNDGSSYNYTHTPGMITGTVHQLNQSNPNLSSQNFSSSKFSEDSSFSGNSSNRGIIQPSNNTICTSSPSVNPPRPISRNRSPGVGFNATNGVSSRPILSQKPKEYGASPMGPRSNNQQDTDSKWTNSYVYNTGTTPGSLSSSVMESLKPKWGPSRDELKDQLANSLASDMNVAILPGFNSNHPKDGRRPFRNTVSDSYLNFGGRDLTSEGEPPERVPSAVTRAQNAIGRSRLEVGQAQSMMEVNKNKAQGIYRNPRGDMWNSMGTPGSGIDQLSVKRYKQDSYRQDLERQIQQKRLKVAEERRQQIEGVEHPLGANYNSPIPSHYIEAPKMPFSLNQKSNLLDDYTRVNNRFQSKHSSDDPVIGRAVTNCKGQHMSQRRHFPPNENSFASNPISAEEVPGTRYSMPALKPEQLQRPAYQQQPQPQRSAYPQQPQPQQRPAYQQQPQPQQQRQQQSPQQYAPPPQQMQPQPQYPFPYYPYGPPAPMGYPYSPQPPQFQGCPQYPMGPAPIRPPAPYQQYQPNTQQQNQSQSNFQNQWPPAFNRQSQELNSTRFERPVSRESPRRDEEKYLADQKISEHGEDELDDGDDCMIPMRMRIWQTSDQLPDPEFKKSAYKVELKKQIIQKQKERTEQMLREAEEDERHDKQIQEYQILMKAEFDKEREELAKACVDKERMRDLELQRTAEHYRLKEKLKSKNQKKQNLDDDEAEPHNGCGDVIQGTSSTSDSSLDSVPDPTTSGTSLDFASSESSLPSIILPALTNSTGSPILSPVKQVTDMRHLSQLQRILASESRRLEQRHLDCGGDNNERTRPTAGKSRTSRDFKIK